MVPTSTNNKNRKLSICIRPNLEKVRQKFISYFIVKKNQHQNKTRRKKTGYANNCKH